MKHEKMNGAMKGAKKLADVEHEGQSHAEATDHLVKSQEKKADFHARDHFD